MASESHDSDFVDADFQASHRLAAASSSPGPVSPFGGAGGGAPGRPPTREELEGKVGETQQRIQELKRAQEALERERAALEEARRRRSDFHVGREEMMQNLARGIGLLEEAEFGARRDAEQMAKTLGELRDAQVKVQNLNDQLWTQENYNAELTRGLTTIENARMEWNAALLKWPVLTPKPEGPGPAATQDPEARPGLASMSLVELGKLGLALTWPLVAVGLLAVGVLAAVLIRR